MEEPLRRKEQVVYKSDGVKLEWAMEERVVDIRGGSARKAEREKGVHALVMVQRLVTYAPDAQHRAEEDHRDPEPPFNRHVANERDEARWQTCARYGRRGVSIIQRHIGI